MVAKQKMSETGTRQKLFIDLAGALLALLEEKGKTQGDVFRATHLERSYISRFATGKIPYPRLETIEIIAGALGMSLEDCLEYAIAYTKKKRAKK